LDFTRILAVCYNKVRLDFTRICELCYNKVRLHFTPKELYVNVPATEGRVSRFSYRSVVENHEFSSSVENVRQSFSGSSCYSARPCDHVSSLHIHLDIANNSSSYSLIIIIRSLPSSASSFPSNIARRMLAKILIQGEQRSFEDECLRLIRSGGPLPTTQVQSKTSSGTSSGPSHASSITTNIATSVSVPRVIKFTGWRGPGVSVHAHLLQKLLALTVIEESFELRP